MKINDFIKKYRIVKEYSKNDDDTVLYSDGMKISRNPYVICKDGFKMSVQAGQSLYSTPKDVADEYEEIEIGYPSEQEVLLEKWAEGASFDEEIEYTNTVYPYVPVEVVDWVIAKHGGIDENAVWGSMNDTQKAESGTYTIIDR